MRSFRSTVAGALVGAAALLAFGAANAALLFEVLRMSDTVAQIQATGVLDVDVDSGRVQLSDSTSTGGPNLDGLAGNFTLGGNPVDVVFVRNSTTDFILTFASNVLEAGDAPAGLMTATLFGETWKPVGTIGSVVIEGTSTTLGHYSIVSAFSTVSEPGTLALLGLGLGLAGLAATHRRRQYGLPQF